MSNWSMFIKRVMIDRGIHLNSKFNESRNERVFLFRIAKRDD